MNTDKREKLCVMHLCGSGDSVVDTSERHMLDENLT